MPTVSIVISHPSPPMPTVSISSVIHPMPARTLQKPAPAQSSTEETGTGCAAPECTLSAASNIAPHSKTPPAHSAASRPSPTLAAIRSSSPRPRSSANCISSQSPLSPLMTWPYVGLQQKRAAIPGQVVL
ncbi:hypothetical protein NEOLI_001852 [Neolecta irregularis DAH-3]|uniref:Uncharacterized protein n=1 Tax=Neolecta irregularis (strain DAH-3) TaxID=1198029 RepID=A0A1U7LHB7_NEOID|nr:hypothetical protein NEOLI_001852 [Neolecta irregularis DAH-3]|eukprot:OLL21942.1 hypothetical protein NEOLI_001852 [Neolecta irregularis DAH-3]